jgi:hypothetical protein
LSRVSCALRAAAPQLTRAFHELFNIQLQVLDAVDYHICNSPYANDGQMETQASSHEREEAKRSRGGHGCNHGRREILSLMRAQLVYIGQRMRKVSL